MDNYTNYYQVFKTPPLTDQDHKEKLPPPGLSPQDSSITDCQTRFDQKCPPATFNTDNKKILINEFLQDDNFE